MPIALTAPRGLEAFHRPRRELADTLKIPKRPSALQRIAGNLEVDNLGGFHALSHARNSKAHGAAKCLSLQIPENFSEAGIWA